MVEIKQFVDKPLAHFGYAFVSNGEAALVDPGRDPKPYLDWIQQKGARLVAVLETHPHADFVSSHKELYERLGATIYINPRVQAKYPHQPIDDRQRIQVGSVQVEALFTPGHSPDHNSYLLYENGEPLAVFTGDSLFIGDVGRPDLREQAGSIQEQRERLASQMFHTIHEVFAELPGYVRVYPAHGKGSLCGRSMREETVSTIAREKQENWAFHVREKDEFIRRLLADQPFIPAYFAYDVHTNIEGAPPLETTLVRVPFVDTLEEEVPVVDIRAHEDYLAGHIPGAINIPDIWNENVETWIGTFFKPGDRFYLAGYDAESLLKYLRRLAKIYYEPFVAGLKILTPSDLKSQAPRFPIEEFQSAPHRFTIIDVRTPAEVATTGPFFAHAINIPLDELPERIEEIPADKPVVVHCAGGYRSDVAESVIRRLRPQLTVFSMGAYVRVLRPAPADAATTTTTSIV